MINDDALDGLVSRIYDAAFGPEGWQDVATCLARTFGTKSSVIQRRDMKHNDTRIVVDGDLLGNHVREYEQHFHRSDVWVDAVARHRNRAFDMDTLVDPDELQKSELYNDYLRPKARIRYAIGAFFDIAGDHAGVIGVHRQQGERGFTSNEVRQFNQLLPHVRRSMMMGLKFGELSSQNAMLSDIVDRMTAPCLVVDSLAHVKHSNASAEALLAKTSALKIERSGTLSCPSTEQAARMRGAVFRASLLAKNGLTEWELRIGLLDHEGQPGLVATIIPISPRRIDFFDTSALVMIFLQPIGARRHIDPDMLMSVFHLTTREAQIAACLAQAMSLAQICDKLEISINTAKSHLKSIFLKTNTKRQQELMALLIGLSQ